MSAYQYIIVDGDGTTWEWDEEGGKKPLRKVNLKQVLRDGWVPARETPFPEGGTILILLVKGEG